MPPYSKTANAGDTIAKDSMYHSKFLLDLHRRSKRNPVFLMTMKMISKNKLMLRCLQNLHFIWIKLLMKIKDIYLNFPIFSTYIK